MHKTSYKITSKFHFIWFHGSTLFLREKIRNSTWIFLLRVFDEVFKTQCLIFLFLITITCRENKWEYSILVLKLEYLQALVKWVQRIHSENKAEFIQSRDLLLSLLENLMSFEYKRPNLMWILANSAHTRILRHPTGKQLIGQTVLEWI